MSEIIATTKLCKKCFEDLKVHLNKKIPSYGVEDDDYCRKCKIFNTVVLVDVLIPENLISGDSL